MPQTFDISQTPQNTKPAGGSGPSSRGTGTVVDDYARNILWIALAFTVLMLGYMGYGLFGNVWTNPAYHAMDIATRQRHLDNIGLLTTGLQITSIIAIICVSICAFRDEGIGYVLAVAAAIFYFGLPYIAGQVWAQQQFEISEATEKALAGLETLGWIYGLPGAIFMLVDFGRRFQAASEAAAIQRANVKYGSNVGRQTTKGQKFLGRCWELPYCRDQVRAKCPIYIRRRGPCWWYKEGCMCEERIVLQAVIQEDWKQQSAMATQKIGLTGAPSGATVAPESQKIGLSAAPAKQLLSPAAKRERCRKCIIYNEHQRQKYKVFATIAVIGVPTLLFLNKDWLVALSSGLLTNVENLTSRFSLASNGSDTLVKSTDNVVLENILLFVVGLVILTQVLKLVEWMILKLKI